MSQLLLPIPREDNLLEWAQSLTQIIQDAIGSGEIVTGGGTLSGQVFYDTSGRVIMDENGHWIYDADGNVPISPDIVQIDTAQLVDAAITTQKIANLAVDTEKLAALAVDAAKLADGSVTEIKIFDSAVTEAKLSNLAVTAAKLADGSVSLSGSKITGQLQSVNLADAAVTTAKLSDLSVEAAKLANSSVTATKIANAAVGTAAIANAAITNAKIGNLAVDTAQIADAAIQSAKIADAAVGNAAIANLAVDSAKIASAAITSAKIANAAVGTAAIAAAAVGTAQIANAAITSALIQDAAVITAKIDNLAVNEAKIANLAVGSGKIQDAAITNAKIGSLAVTTAKIANLAVTNAKINDLAVNKLTAGTIGVDQIYLGSLRFHFDGVNERIEIKDNQGSPVERVRIGKLGAGATDYGIEIKDSSGAVILSTGRTFDHTLVDALQTVNGPAEAGADITSIHSNSIDNPEFEAGDTGWTIVGNWAIQENSANARLGDFAARLTAGSGASDIESTGIQVEPGDRVLGQGFLKATAGANTVYAGVRWRDSAGATLSAASGNQISSSSYALSRVVATAPANAVSAHLFFATTDSDMAAWADGAYLAIIPKDADIDVFNTTNAGNIVGSHNQLTSGNITTYMSGAAIGTAQIANAAITTAKIGDAEVETLKIAGNAVTVPVSSFTLSSSQYDDTTDNATEVEYTIESHSVDVTDVDQVYITFSCNSQHVQGTGNVELRFYRDSTELVAWSDNNTPSSTGLIDGQNAFTYSDDTSALSGSKTYAVKISLNSNSSTTLRYVISHRSLFTVGTKR